MSNSITRVIPEARCVFHTWQATERYVNMKISECEKGLAAHSKDPNHYKRKAMMKTALTVFKVTGMVLVAAAVCAVTLPVIPCFFMIHPLIGCFMGLMLGGTALGWVMVSYKASCHFINEADAAHRVTAETETKRLEQLKLLQKGVDQGSTALTSVCLPRNEERAVV